MSPWRGFRAWLGSAPIADPVDRRNAATMQLILLMLGLLPPLLWLHRIVVSDLPWRQGESTSLAISLAISVLSMFELWLIRRGRFQWAVRLFLAAIGAGMLQAYRGGMESNSFELALQAAWLAMAGLMIGRKALWLMLGWIVLCFAIGTAADIRNTTTDTPRDLIAYGLISSLVFLFVAVVVDRSVTALRESLQAVTRQARELDVANRQLHAEIAERERVQEQLIHAQKMEAVGRLASGVAHDFNHLLGLVLGYAGRARRARDAQDREAALAGVESAGRRATAVAHKLLNFSRQDQTRYEVFDAAEALREMQPMLQQLFDLRIRIALEADAGAYPIGFDRAQFELMVLNLAVNANQAMPGGGIFRARVADAADGGVALEFVDSGHGMDEETRQRVFEPFFTTRPPGEGTGLGLAVVANLVSDAGGRIEAESTPMRGALFRLWLPRASLELPVAREA